MTLKKDRHKLFKILRKKGWPWTVAAYYSKHLYMPKDYKYIDDLTLGRNTYFNQKLNVIVYINDDDEWSQIKVTKPLYNYYDL